MVLVKFSDSDFRLSERWEDIRGKDVYDVNGDEVGSVKDLYVEPEERDVRFLDVGAGGFLGIGDKHFMVPVEAITDVSEDRVTISQGREKVMGAPDFDTDVVPEAAYQREVYGYYGYPPH
jgi:sporulation protein YlmC with PRC-barrel domain